MLKQMLLAIVMLGTAGCSGPPMTEIGSGWFVDETKAPWAHLYHVVDGKRVVVDRLIYSYRLYYKVCLAYESSRSEGRVMFIVAGNRTPYPVAVSDTQRPWRIDADGLRRFETQEDEDGGRLLAIEFIDFSDLCTAAQMAVPFEDNWAETTRIVDGKEAKIVESVVDVNGGDSVGNSTLSEAVRVGQITVIDALLRAGADINAANRHGGTPLMTAVSSRKTDLVRQLLAGGARINAQNDDGQTALMGAARMRNPEMAELLLDAGADMTIRDDLGRNAAAHLPDGGGPEMDKLRARFTRVSAQ
jgi:Ankyrin repeats (3 copies)